MYGTEQGDLLVPPDDDGSSPKIILYISFPFFGSDEMDLYVRSSAHPPSSKYFKFTCTMHGHFVIAVLFSEY